MAAQQQSSRFGEIVRFAIVGIVATAVHYAVYYLLLSVMGHNLAYTIGYALSFGMNYLLSSLFTFRVDMSVKRLMSFALSHALNYLLQIMLLNVFIGIGMSAAFAPLPVFVIAVPVNFLLVRYALTRRDRRDDGYWLFLAFVGFAMLWLQLLDAPTLSDDMLYRFMWNADETAPVVPVESLGDLLRSQWTHYQCVNGRFVVHVLAQGFLEFLPPVVLQVINTLLFVVLLHFSCSWLSTSGRQRLYTAVAVCFLLFVVFQGMKTTMLWSLGTMNYLWVTVAVLGLLLWMRQTDRHPLRMHLLLTPLALLAGWSHEALSLPLSAAFLVYIICHRHELRQRPVVLYMLWFMAGTALCMLSPGIWSRSADAVSLQSRLISGAVNCVSNIRVFWLLAITLLVLRKKNRPLLRQHLHAHRYAYVALLVAFGIVLLCGTNLERVAFYLDFMAMLLLLSILRQVVSAVWARRLMPVCLVIMVLFYVPVYMVRHENSENWKYAEQQMKAPDSELIAVRQPVEGDNCLLDYFRSRYVNSSISFGFYGSYMAFDATDINNRCAAQRYGKHRLIFLPEDVVTRIKTDATAYSHYELDRRKELYVWQQPTNEKVTAVRFVLKEEDLSQLCLPQRLLAYKGDSYELDDFHYKLIDIDGRYYLVFTRPTTNIYRRIRDIELSH